MGANESSLVKPVRADEAIGFALTELARLAAAGKPSCVTLEVPGNKRAWVQVTDDSLNVSYPYESDPEEWLPVMGLALPSGLRITNWEAFVFVEFDYVDRAPLARLIHDCFTVLLKQEGKDFLLTASTFQF